jgi:hypothetical protein
VEQVTATAAAHVSCTDDARFTYGLGGFFEATGGVIGKDRQINDLGRPSSAGIATIECA